MKTPPTVSASLNDIPSPMALPSPAISRKRKMGSPCSTVDLSLEARPSSPTLDLNEEAIWEQARAAREEAGHLSDVESEPESTDSECDEPRRKRGSAMARLPDGDIHVCRPGNKCPFLAPNDDRIMVCQYTGVEHGPETTFEFFDLSNGLGQRTGDQDATCGEPQHGKWIRRIDPVVASRQAFDAADMFDEEGTHHLAYRSNSDAAAPLRNAKAKRGALCVGEEAPRESTRRLRSNKRNVTDQHSCQNLHSEAQAVLGKLINYDRTSSFKRKPDDSKTRRSKPCVDPRMQDRSFVFRASVKRYVRECISSGTAPHLNTLHNLALMADHVSQKARDEAAAQGSSAIRTAKFRRLVGSLVVALWAAMCNTPYMINSKRGNDAYRPFVCGVLYGMKRSVKLQCGGVLIPACPELAAALPQLRGTGGNLMAKTLHSSAHRGVCTLSRCIASVPAAQQRIVFGDVLKITTTFDSTVFRSSDV